MKTFLKIAATAALVACVTVAGVMVLAPVAVLFKAVAVLGLVGSGAGVRDLWFS